MPPSKKQWSIPYLFKILSKDYVSSERLFINYVAQQDVNTF